MSQSNLVTKKGPIRRGAVVKVDQAAIDRKIQEHALTLIGRVWFPKFQHMDSLIHNLPKFWQLEGRISGVDLGAGRFHFQFQSEEELQGVLLNSPYHYDSWMVSLVRWKPVTASEFPSEISFWIRVRGIPTIYYGAEVLWSIARDLGEAVDADASIGCIRVTMNGFNPLVFEMVLPFDNGDEALISLEYDKLFNHCKHCSQLSHLREHCPELVGHPRDLGAVSMTSAPLDEPQWEIQRKKSGKRAFTGSELAPSDSGLSRAPLPGKVPGASNRGVVLRESGGDKRPPTRESDRLGKQKAKRTEYLKEMGLTSRPLHAGRSRPTSWSRSLYPARGTSSLVQETTASGSKTQVHTDNLVTAPSADSGFVQAQGWVASDSNLLTDGYQLDDNGLFDEEGELVELDVVDTGIMTLQECLHEADPSEPSHAGAGTSSTPENLDFVALEQSFKDVAVSGLLGSNVKNSKREFTLLGTSLKKRLLSNVGKGKSKPVVSQQVQRKTQEEAMGVAKSKRKGKVAIPKPLGRI